MVKHHTKEVVDLTSQHRKQKSTIITVTPNKPVGLFEIPTIGQNYWESSKYK